MNKLLMIVASIYNEIKLHCKYKISYDKYELQNRRLLSIFLVHTKSLLKVVVDNK
jgi:hypothetical protein